MLRLEQQRSRDLAQERRISKRVTLRNLGSMDFDSSPRDQSQGSQGGSPLLSRTGALSPAGGALPMLQPIPERPPLLQSMTIEPKTPVQLGIIQPRLAGSGTLQTLQPSPSVYASTENPLAETIKSQASKKKTVRIQL